MRRPQLQLEQQGRRSDPVGKRVRRLPLRRILREEIQHERGKFIEAIATPCRLVRFFSTAEFRYRPLPCCGSLTDGPACIDQYGAGLGAHKPQPFDISVQFGQFGAVSRVLIACGAAGDDGLSFRLQCLDLAGDMAWAWAVAWIVFAGG
jgi:hypothetical protein